MLVRCRCGRFTNAGLTCTTCYINFHIPIPELTDEKRKPKKNAKKKKLKL